MTDRKKRHRVVIIGGGFGGLWATRSLRSAEVDITLVDKRNFHLFQPLLYQVATGALSPADIASPLRGVLANQRNVTVKLSEMKGIDLDARVVFLKDGELVYDSLVIATGSENHYFGNDEWSRVATGLKTVEDALRIRNTIFHAFERAEKESDPARRQQFLTFVIVGGGPTGVELAGALGEIARITLRGNFRSVDPSTARIVVLEGTDDILTSFPPSLRTKAFHSLENLGVEIVTGAIARDIDDSGVTVVGGGREYRIEAETVLWAAGIRPSPIGKLLTSDNSGLDQAGRVIVNADLTLPDHPNVYVIGDLATIADYPGGQLPGNAPVAMSQGRYVARTIVSKARSETYKPYRYRSRGNMAVLGRAAAVADLGWARFSGYPAWLLWLFVHLLFLVEFDNRLVVLIQWAWSYFTRNRGARLITNDSTGEGNN